MNVGISRWAKLSGSYHHHPAPVPCSPTEAQTGSPDRLTFGTPENSGIPTRREIEAMRARLAEHSQAASNGTRVDRPTSSARPQRVTPAALAAARRMGYHVGADGKRKALSPEELQKVAESLSKLPAATLEKLRRQGFKIEVNEGSWPGRESSTEGEYDPSSKVIHILASKLGSETIEGKPVDRLVHELGHACDDMLKRDGQGGTKRQSDESDFGDLFNAYQFRQMKIGDHQPEIGKRFGVVTGQNRREYFAEGTRLYLSSPETREELRQKDPELYAYLQKVYG